MPPELRVDIRLSRPRFTLDVSFEVPPGISILFGPSGAGKSTVLGAIAGLLRPDGGRIVLGDEVWFDAKAGTSRSIEDRKVAYVFQSLALFPHLTALENVEYGIDRAVHRRQRRASAESMLERMRVPHLRDRYPRTFSGGEAQRVALARAFAMTPKLVLLDEPFSAMDRELRRELAAELRSFAEEAKVPLLHVTHRRNEARTLGQRVILMEGGRVSCVGEVESVLPEVELGAPASQGSAQMRARS
jgi:molybdate transport system ATP-binding protein